MKPMPTPDRLIEIGSKVRIDLGQVKDRIPEELIQLLSDDNDFTVLDYKITDGQGIGVIIQLENGKRSCVFEDEIAFPTVRQKIENSVTDIGKERYLNSSIKKKEIVIQEQDTSPLLSPLTFLRWLAYSLKDVI